MKEEVLEQEKQIGELEDQTKKSDEELKQTFKLVWKKGKEKYYLTISYNQIRFLNNIANPTLANWMSK